MTALAMNLAREKTDYERIEKALAFIEESFPEHPELHEIAHNVGLSGFHFQKMFQRWVGISPKRFIQFLSKEYALRKLAESKSILDAAFDSGLSGTGRLHDLMVSCEAMTPGEIKSRGEGLVIRYGRGPTPFGDCAIAMTDRGVCRLEFVTGQETPLSEWKSMWPNAKFKEDPEKSAALIRQTFAASRTKAVPLHLLLTGTNFQIQVWQALLRIPPGNVLSYEDVARMIGRPKAVRAVAGAIAHNRIAFVIPCHRVIRKMGIVHEYYYGPLRKKAMLAWEAALTAS